MAEITVDLDKASDDDLHSIAHTVTRKLAERARLIAAGEGAALYNNHNSVHSNHSPQRVLPIDTT